MATMKIANLMDLPPKVLMEDLFTTGSKNVYYPRPLLDMWMKSVPTPHESPAGQYLLFRFENFLMYNNWKRRNST